MTLSGRASRWFAPGLLLMVTAGAISLVTISHLVAANDAVTHTWDVLVHVNALVASVSEAEAAGRDYVVTGLNQYEVAYFEARTRATRVSEELTELTTDNPSQQSRLSTLDGLIHERVQRMDEVLRTRREKGLDAALELSRTVPGLRLTKGARSQIDAITAEEQRLLTIRLAKVRHLVAIAQGIFGGAVAVSLMLALLGFRDFQSSVVQALSDLAGAARQYGAGDLSQRFPVRGGDEIRQLAVAFNDMAERRQRAERGLRAAAITRDAIISASPLPIIGISPAGVVLTWNRAAEKVFGWTAEEAIGRPLPNVPEAERPAFERMVRETLHKNIGIDFEVVRRRKDGSPVEVRITASPIHVEGAGATVVGVFEDIGARKERERARARMLEAEQELSQKLEALAHASISIAHESAIDAGLDNLLQLLVEQARRIAHADFVALGIGADPERQFSSWIFSGMPPEVVTAIGRNPRPRGLLGWVVHQGQTIRLKDLHQHPAFVGFPQSHPGMEAFLGVPIRYEGQTVGNLYLANGPGRPPFTDSDQRAIELLAGHAGVAIENARLQKAVRAERARFQILADASASLAQTLSLDEMCEILVRIPVPSLADACLFDRYTPDGAVDRVVSAVRADVAAILQVVRRDRLQPAGGYLAGEIARAGASRILSDADLRESGECLWLEAPERLTATLNPQSALVVKVAVGQRLLGILTCLSAKADRYRPDDLSLLEELARRAALSFENGRLFEETQRAVRVRKDLLAIVSHDLRGPLTAIQMNADMLARGVSSGAPEGAETRVQIVQRSAQRMSRMIEDLLDAAAIEAGRLSITRERHPVEPCLREVIEMAEHSAREKGQRLRVRVGGELPDVHADRDRMLQVLGNLVANAIKFTPEGGEITVSAQVRDEEVLFSVADTGPGIDRENLSRLFHRYSQAPGTKQRGTGLGLFISRGIVEAHGGRIWVESYPGRGTTVCFTLPAWLPA